MWKAAVGTNINTCESDDGDWETDPDFINNVTEQEQRWGSKTIEGSGRTVGAIDMNKLREETTKGNDMAKERQKADAPNASYGYGGKFGVEKDRMDRSAVGHDYIAKVEKHVSQTDYSTGFGGKFGVQTDRVDKSAVSWDHKESLVKHASQKDYSSGFGGKYGVERDRQDKSALGWDHVEKLQKHDSQTVGKSDQVVVEQTQKPSQLKAKFENLAKQNEVKPKEKMKSTVQKAPVISSVPPAENSSSIQEPVKLLIEEKQSELREVSKTQFETTTQQYKQEQVQALEPKVNANLVVTTEECKAVEEEEAEKIIEQLENEPSYTAIALYDYQAAADDEISFDPDEIITNIEMIDEGWWRGMCRGRTGLFPANYVQLQE